MNALIPALLATLLTAQSVPLPRTDEEGLAYFEQLYRNRAEITCGHLDYTLTTDKEPRFPDLEGSVKTYGLWFDEDRRRLDISEVRPSDPKNALATRYSYTDGVHRIIDIDRQNVVAREFSSDYLKGKEPPLVMAKFGHLIDPRLLGIIGMEFDFLQHHRLDELKVLNPAATVSVRHDSASNKTEIIVSRQNGSSTTYSLTPASLLPVKIITKSAKNFPDGRPAPDRRVEVESEIVSMRNSRGESFDFPRSLKIRRIKDGQLESGETIAILKADFNVPVDPKEMTWKALHPAIGVGLISDGDYKRSESTAIQWDGENFTLLPAPPLTSAVSDHDREPVPQRGSWIHSTSWITLCLGIVLAGIFVVTKASRHE